MKTPFVSIKSKTNEKQAHRPSERWKKEKQLYVS